MNNFSKEFKQSPIQFLMNGAQIIFLITIAYNMGGFHAQFVELKKTVMSTIQKIEAGFEANAGDHKKISNAIILHTGKPIQ